RMDRFNSLLIQDTDAFQAGNHAERAIEHSATGYRVGVGTDRHGRTAIRPPASDHITRPVHPGFQAVGPETVHEPSSRLHVYFGQPGTVDSTVFGVEPEFPQFIKIVFNAFDIDPIVRFHLVNISISGGIAEIRSETF